MKKDCVLVCKGCQLYMEKIHTYEYNIITFLEVVVGVLLVFIINCIIPSLCCTPLSQYPLCNKDYGYSGSGQATVIGH